MINLFVYHTLMDTHLVKKIVGRKVMPEKATLVNYKMMQHKGYPYLEWSKGSFVHGELLELTREELDKTDKWESKYKRIPIRLEDGTPAWCYELKEELRAIRHT